jgi:hypothetical protein
MNRIAGEFCAWLRDLPGEDRTVNQMGEAALRALFDTAQSTNPGKTKLAEGLRAWVKFGTAVTGTGKHRVVMESATPLLYNKKYAEKILDRRDGFKQFQVKEKGRVLRHAGGPTDNRILHDPKKERQHIIFIV